MNVQTQHTVVIGDETHSIPNLSGALVKGFAIGTSPPLPVLGSNPATGALPVVHDFKTASELLEFARRHDPSPKPKDSRRGGAAASNLRKVLKVLGVGAGVELEWKGSNVAWQGFQLSNTATAADVNSELLKCGVAPGYASNLAPPILEVLKSTTFKALCVAVASGGFTLMILDTMAIKKQSRRRRRIWLSVAVGFSFALLYLILKASHVLT